MESFHVALISISRGLRKLSLYGLHHGALSRRATPCKLLRRSIGRSAVRDLGVVPIGPALDYALECGLVLLARHLPGGLIQIGVGLDKHLSGLLLLKHHVPNLGAPEFESNIRHVEEILGACLDVGRRLVDVELLEELANSYSKSNSLVAPVVI